METVLGASHTSPRQGQGIRDYQACTSSWEESITSQEASTSGHRKDLIHFLCGLPGRSAQGSLHQLGPGHQH